MIEPAIAFLLLAGAILMFGAAVIVGLALGRRLDRVVVARINVESPRSEAATAVDSRPERIPAVTTGPEPRRFEAEEAGTQHGEVPGE